MRGKETKITTCRVDEDVHGIESYYLDTTSDKYALRLAAVENKVREERVSEIQLALAQASSRLHTQASKNIARKVNDSLAKVARKQTGRVRNLGVKSSLFYVLLGEWVRFVSKTQDDFNSAKIKHN